MTQAILTGLTVGGVYVLLGLGLTLQLGVADIVNLAHGSFVVAGMYFVYVMVVNLGLPLYAAVILSVPVFALVGAVMYKLYFEPARHRGHRDQVIYSLLLLGALAVLFQIAFGSDLVSIPTQAKNLEVLGASVDPHRIVALVVSLVVAAAIAFFLSRTTAGKAVRAAAQYEEGARSIGIPVELVFVGVFATGSALAGLAGGLLVTFLPVSPELALQYLIIVLVVAIAGRLTLLGCTLVGLGYGVLQVTLQQQFGPVASELLIFGGFLFVLALGATMPATRRAMQRVA